MCLIHVLLLYFKKFTFENVFIYFEKPYRFWNCFDHPNCAFAYVEKLWESFIICIQVLTIVK